NAFTFDMTAGAAWPASDVASLPRLGCPYSNRRSSLRGTTRNQQKRPQSESRWFMADVNDLLKRIDAEFDANRDKLKAFQAEKTQEHVERQQRLERFDKLL